MPATEYVRGVDSAEILFDSLSLAARDEMRTMLASIGNLYLRAEQRDVAFDTGETYGDLTIDQQTDRLRVRIGLFFKGRSKVRLKALVLEYGRQAQTVVVQRRRRMRGRLRTQSRGSRKRVSDIVATYSLQVKAREARPFIHNPRTDVSAQVAGLEAQFWSRVYSKAGAA